LLSLAIVTFNSRRIIGTALDSILTHLPAGLDPRLTIVDNRSEDGTPELLQDYAERDARVKVVRNRVNVGYGRAHNQALAAAASRFHVVCNPDIIVEADVFSPLSRVLEDCADIGIACPLFRSPDGSVQPLNRRYPTVLDLGLRRFLPQGLKPIFRKRLDAYEMRDAGYDRPCEVPFMTGAFMFARTEVLKRVGGFDERFFLYFEDVDLSRKVQAAGYRTVFHPEVAVTHAWERMAHKNWPMAWVFCKSGFRYFRKWGLRLW
jgi:GT2 family glycosyltransferase